MDSFKLIHDLMVEVGPLLEALEISEYAEARTWTILLEEHLLILECDEQHGILHISTLLAEPPENGRDAIYHKVLKYSGERQATNNYRVGLVEKGGALALIKTDTVYGYDKNRLYTVLKEFVVEAKEVTTMIEQGDGNSILHEASSHEMIFPA